jgi:hypothetical protein
MFTAFRDRIPPSRELLVNSPAREFLGKSKILDLFLGLLLFIYLFTIIRTSNLELNNDFRSFYTSARSFLKGEDIYLNEDPNEERPATRNDTIQVFHPNLNPPFFTLLVLPFGSLNYKFAFSIFSFLSVFSGVIAIWTINRKLFFANSKQVLRPALVLYLAFFPTLAAVVLGQISIYLLLILTIIWVVSRTGRDKTAGLLLGLALAVKLYTGLFLVFFLVRRRWRVVTWYIISFIILNLVSLFVLGINTFKNYLDTLRNIYWYDAVWNASFLGFSSRVFQNIYGSSYESPARMVGLLLSLLLLAAILWVTWSDNKLTTGRLVLQRYDLSFALYLVAMLLISPLGWMYYFPLLLLPFLIIWRIANQCNQIKLAKVTIAAWLLSTIPILQNSTAGENFFVTLSQGGVYSYSLLISSGILLHQILTLKKMDERNTPQFENKTIQTITTI